MSKGSFKEKRETWTD